MNKEADSESRNVRNERERERERKLKSLVFKKAFSFLEQPSLIIFVSLLTAQMYT